MKHIHSIIDNKPDNSGNNYFNRKTKIVSEADIIRRSDKLLSLDELDVWKKYIKGHNLVIAVLKPDVQLKTYSKQCFHAIIKNNPELKKN